VLLTWRRFVPDRQHVTLIGHPFASIGMGEQLRACARALDAVGVEYGIYDVYRYSKRTDHEHLALLASREVSDIASGVRVFHINGDEVEPVLAAMRQRGFDFSAGRNVVVPAWELPNYPSVWKSGLETFDEVWAISAYVHEALTRAGLRSHFVGQSLEIPSRAFLSRRYFGIRESALVFLHFLDLTSFAARKNPEAAVELFERLRALRPLEDIQLVLKVKNGEAAASDWVDELRERLHHDAVLITDVLTTFETHSLISCSDCFVSLHRAEGTGRGAGEAMCLGRTALATAWSGNLDYMDPKSALCVNYKLVPVPPGAYPHGEGQLWADPDLEHALQLALRLVDEPAFRRSTELAGSRAIAHRASNRTVGLRMLERLQAERTEAAPVTL
jgi:hypothetical protein